MGKDVIIALDFDSREKTLAFLDRFADEERKPSKPEKILLKCIEVKRGRKALFS